MPSAVDKIVPVPNKAAGIPMSMASVDTELRVTSVSLATGDEGGVLAGDADAVVLQELLGAVEALRRQLVVAERP